MTTRERPWRHPLLRLALGLGLVCMTVATQAARRPNDSPSPTASEPAAHGPAAGHDDDKVVGTPRPAAAGPGLTVHVSGGGKPVAQADVRFKFASGAELTGRTDDRGTVRVSPPADGLTKVRVVAVGWDSGKGEVAVKRGKPSELSIQLQREADPQH